MQSIHCKTSSHPPRLLLSKDLLLSCLSKASLPPLKLKDSLLVPKIELEISLAGMAADPDSKTATVAINTDDEAWSISNEQSLTTFNTYVKSHKLQYLQLECMRYIWFPLYGILEKAVQTDISIPFSSVAKGNNTIVLEERIKDKSKQHKRKKPEGNIDRLQLNESAKETRLKKLLEEDTEIHNTKRLFINKILEEDLHGT